LTRIAGNVSHSGNSVNATPAGVLSI
jgi:hypothetical protein